MDAQIVRRGGPDQSLIGRESELVAIEAALTEHRLVTLTGLGGCGKTSLAGELARRTIARGTLVHLVDLAPVADSTTVTTAIAAALGARESSTMNLEAASAATLTGAPSLLVLDNFEQVLAAAPTVAWLLDHAPEARILVTSRVALGLDAEQEIRLEPLAVPETTADIDAAPASRLFLRSAGLGASSDLVAEDRAAVAGICRSLDGLPLALELAASWTSILSPRAIQRRLNEGALRLDRPGDRQASLEQIIGATLGLVDSEAREAFERLGAFAGAFDEEAARAVLDREDALVPLRTLAEVAVLHVGTGTDGEPSFRFLETVRTEARRRLGDAGAGLEVGGRHAEHYATRAQAAAHRLRTQTFGDPEAAARLADPNVLAAFEFAVDAGEPELASRLAAAMASGAIHSGSLSAAMARIVTALDLGPVPPGIRSDALNALVSLRGALGETGLVDLAREAVATARAANDRGREVRALVTLGNQLRERGVEAQEEAIRIATEIDYHSVVATANMNLGFMHEAAGRIPQALACFEAAQAAFERAVDRVGGAIALASIGDIQVSMGRPEVAMAHFEAALPILRESAPAQYQTVPLVGLAILLVGAGDQAGAYAHLAEASDLLGETESRDAWNDVAMAASIVLARDHPSEAARAFGAVDASAVVPAYAGRLETTAEGLRRTLGQARFERERRAGARAGGHALGAEIAGVIRSAKPVLTLHLRAAFEAFTPREGEVLRLLSEGKADPEIAALLRMTPKTASVHVANIKGKLGVANRVEAALMARRMLDGLSSEARPSDAREGRMGRTNVR